MTCVINKPEQFNFFLLVDRGVREHEKNLHSQRTNFFLLNKKKCLNVLKQIHFPNIFLKYKKFPLQSKIVFLLSKSSISGLSFSKNIYIYINIYTRKKNLYKSLCPLTARGGGETIAAAPAQNASFLGASLFNIIHVVMFFSSSYYPVDTFDIIIFCKSVLINLWISITLLRGELKPRFKSNL